MTDNIPSWVEYDAARDDLILHGVRYAAPLFEGLGIATIGETFRVVKNQGGVLTLERLSPAPGTDRRGAPA